MRTQCIRKEKLNDPLESKAQTSNSPAAACPVSPLLIVKTQSSLQQLLQVCLQTGHDASWTEFFSRSQPVISGVITKTIRRWIRPSPDLIDDLVQETYVKLCFDNFRALRRFSPRHENALNGFLKVVASNTVRDHFRNVSSWKHGRGITAVPLDDLAKVYVPGQLFEAFERAVLL